MTDQVKEPKPIMYKTPRAVLQCDYDEGVPQSYRGIVIDYGDAGSRFFTGKPYLDRYAARKEAREAGCKIIVSSSWENFVSDAVDYFVGASAEEEHVHGGSEQGE